MAYDPRTGIQSFAQLDPAADVNAAIDVPEAIAPSTATALAPTPKSLGDFYAQYGVRRPSFGEGKEYEQLSFAERYNLAHPGYAADFAPSSLAKRASQAGDVDAFWTALDAINSNRSEMWYHRSPEAENNLIWGFSPEVFPADRVVPGAWNRYGYVGEDLITQPLDQLAAAAGAEGDVDWLPYLEQYYMEEYADQLAHGRKPSDIFTHRQGYGDILSGVSGIASQQLDLPQLGEIAAQNIGPGTDFYNQYNELPNWIESRRDEARTAKAWATMLPVLTGLFAPYITPAVSSAAGGGALGTVASGAVMGGIQGLATGDPVGGALRGGLTAGVSDVAAPAVSDFTGGMLDRLGFDPMAAFADDPTKLQGALPAYGYSTPAQIGGVDIFGNETPYSTPAMTTMREPGMLPYSVQTDALIQSLGGLGSISAPTEAPTVAEERAALGAAETAPADPSLLDQAARYAKIGNALAQLGGGQGTPQDAPQRGEGQSDAQYAQSLADYINVDARVLADQGLIAGTPDYYNYLLSQADASINNLTRGLNLNAADLQQQFRGKTQEELQSLRRALYVRGQLDQLMGSGAYADPFTGLSEEVITDGMLVNPNVAAYQRGLGRSIGGFEAPGDVSEFLGRETDPFGMQARADTRAEQEGRALAMLEALKRRQGGMLGGGLGGASEAEFAELLDMMQQQQR